MASRAHSPLAPGALRVVIAIIGFVALTRILYRILDSPWVTGGAGGGDQTPTVTDVIVGWSAWASVAGAALVTLAGIIHAVAHARRERRPPSCRVEQVA